MAQCWLHLLQKAHGSQVWMHLKCDTAFHCSLKSSLGTGPCLPIQKVLWFCDLCIFVAVLDMQKSSWSQFHPPAKDFNYTCKIHVFSLCGWITLSECYGTKICLGIPLSEKIVQNKHYLSHPKVGVKEWGHASILLKHLDILIFLKEWHNY